MACACSTSRKNAGKKYTVKYPNGTVYKVYTNQLEAEAAKLRVGGTISVS